jgi:formylmethanofuran dehydrogenase subunit E
MIDCDDCGEEFSESDEDAFIGAEYLCPSCNSGADEE